MIRKLNATNKQELLRFLEKDKELNLFIIGDIENYGFNQTFLEYWGEFNENEQLIAVLMKFYEGFTVYSTENFDVIRFSEIIKVHDYKSLSGEMSIVEKFSKFIEVNRKREMYFSKLENPDELYKGEQIELVRKTEIEDAEKLWLFHRRRNGGIDVQPLERLERKLKDRSGRGYHIKNDDGEIISSAETTAENSYSAMVVGVVTDEAYGGCGYATAIVSKLCREVLKEGKTLCLFYDNPKAGKIYERLGFQPIGKWSMWTR